MMADTIKSSSQLKLGFNDHNNKIKYVNVDYPRSNLTEEQIRDVGEYIVNNQIFFDSMGIPYSSIETAYTENRQIRELDLDQSYY